MWWLPWNVCFHSNQARVLLRDSDDPQVLPRQDRNHEALHSGGCEVVRGHDGTLVRCVWMLRCCRGWRPERDFDTKWFLFQDNAKRKAMMLAFKKHNKLMAEAQEGHGELMGLTFLFFVRLMGRMVSECFLLHCDTCLCRLWQAPSGPVSDRQRGGTSDSRTLLRSPLCKEVLCGKLFWFSCMSG